MSQVQMENKGKVKGDSAYEIAVKNGFTGTEAQWLESLKADSVDLSAIESAIQDLDNTKIEEAPKDGKQYVRQNGAWSEVSSSGGSYNDAEVRNLIAENTADINNLNTNKVDKTAVATQTALGLVKIWVSGTTGYISTE